MKKILLFFYLSLKKLGRNISWLMSIKKERKSLSACDGIRDLPLGKTLVLIPHSDDEWIGCSGIITSGEEVLLCNVDMQGDDLPELHKLRYKEMELLASEYNKELRTLSGNKAEELGALIDDWKPEYIALPFFVDWHNEHIQVMRIFADSIMKMTQNPTFEIIAYQVSVPICAPCVTHCIRFDRKTLSEKWKVFKEIYKTQKSALPFSRFRANERINGAYADAYACEVYSVFDLGRWLEIKKTFSVGESEADTLYKELNNITSIREKSKALCESLNSL